jgi:hypothetical protein
MCWWTITVVSIILLASFFMMPSASIDKEGFITYVVYGPGGWFGAPPGYGRRWVPYGDPWLMWRRRHRYNGPCPGPWCPYYY